MDDMALMPKPRKTIRPHDISNFPNFPYSALCFFVRMPRIHVSILFHILILVRHVA